jgi:hypothetical protein
MKRLNWKSIGGFIFLALLGDPVRGSVPPQPGTINYIEGLASIGGQLLSESSVGSVKLLTGQSVSTQAGKVEMLLTPGVFLRIDAQSSVQMISPGLANTVLLLQKGRAMVEVAEIHPENNLRMNVGATSTQMLRAGLYDFDADHGQILVFDGRAMVQAGGRKIDLGRDREVSLNAPGKLKDRRFDKKVYEDDFYRWSSLRSSYVSEANIDAARRYAGVSGYSPEMWGGGGWYWDSPYDAYTFIPEDGIFYSPFGWGFYSPWCAFDAPFFGFGYGGFGYGYGYGGFGRGRYGAGVGGTHRFGAGYHPSYSAARASGSSAGHAYHVSGSTVRSGGFGGGGFRGGGSAGRFRGAGGGGGFRGGGGGGGFHGGGGGGGHGR